MPTIDIPDKVCPHCGGIRWRVEKIKRPSLINPNYVKTRYRCAKKIGEKYKRWSQAHPEKIKEYQIGTKKDWRTPQGREYYRKREAKHCANLTDKYVKYTLRHNPIYRNATITPEMIERQRQYLKVQRQLKNLENGKRKQTEQAETDRRRSLSNGRQSKERIREIQQSQLSERSSVSLSLQHASNERSNALCSTRNKKVNRNQLKFNNMSRRSIFSTVQLQLIKKEIRKGVKVKELARTLAPKFNLTEEKMLNKLYYISAHTYLLRGRPKKSSTLRKTTTVMEAPKAAPVVTSKAIEEATGLVGKKIVMYGDHIRIYF